VVLMGADCVGKGNYKRAQPALEVSALGKVGLDPFQMKGAPTF
jgi:hypothetical protein